MDWKVQLWFRLATSFRVFDSDLQSLGSAPEVLDWDDCNEMQSMEGFKSYSYDFLQV